MPVNAGGAIQTDMLSGIEEESDIYEAFAPHVDFTNIPLSTESSPGESIWFDFLELFEKDVTESLTVL